MSLTRVKKSVVAPNVGLLSFRNKVINGNFDIWQRGLSNSANGYGPADHWYHAAINGTTFTATQQLFTLGQTDVPGNPKYFMRCSCVTGSAASGYYLVENSIEDVTTLSGEKAVLSFYAKADSAKDIAVNIYQIFGTGGSDSVMADAVTFSLTTSWQKFIMPVSMPSITDKILGANDRVLIRFWFDAGSDYNSMSNTLGNQSGTFDLAKFQFEEGEEATPFEQRPIGLELMLCQRYFEKSYNLEQAPGALVLEGTYRGYLLDGVSFYDFGKIPFKVSKRTTPTVVVYNPVTGATDQMYNYTNLDSRNCYPSDASNNGFRVYSNNGVANMLCGVHWTASAEL